MLHELPSETAVNISMLLSLWLTILVSSQSETLACVCESIKYGGNNISCSHSSCHVRHRDPLWLNIDQMQTARIEDTVEKLNYDVTINLKDWCKRQDVNRVVL